MRSNAGSSFSANSVGTVPVSSSRRRCRHPPAESGAFAVAPLFGLLLQRQRGAAAKAQLVELVNDELDPLAALIGTLLVLSGVLLGDPVAAIAVATSIAAATRRWST
jgi:hypothetical protein